MKFVEGAPTVRGAGFQPASAAQRGLRRPKHHDLGQIPYFITTRTHKFERIFTATVAEAAVDELFKLRRTYEFLLASFVFMPDHAHFMIVPAEGFTISQTMRVLKGRIARRINADFDREGPVWQDGFRDNASKSIDELHAYINYTEQNPVRAGLASDAAAYAFSTADGRCEADYQAFFLLERDDAG